MLYPTAGVFALPQGYGNIETKLWSIYSILTKDSEHVSVGYCLNLSDLAMFCNIALWTFWQHLHHLQSHHQK